MTKRSLLRKEAYTSFKLLEEQRYQARATRILDEEPSLAVFLLWCNIEVLLRLLKYHHKIQEPWPKKLDFIRPNWGPLKHIKGINSDAYDTIFKANESLWKRRNEIAHTGKFIEKQEISHFLEHANFVIDNLNSNLPKREDFLAKKKRSDAQRNSKKN